VECGGGSGVEGYVAQMVGPEGKGNVGSFKPEPSEGGSYFGLVRCQPRDCDQSHGVGCLGLVGVVGGKQVLSEREYRDGDVFRFGRHVLDDGFEAFVYWGLKSVDDNVESVDAIAELAEAFVLFDEFGEAGSCIANGCGCVHDSSICSVGLRPFGPWQIDSGIDSWASTEFEVRQEGDEFGQER